MKVTMSLTPLQYVGRWYEIEKFDNPFQMGMECITADYTPIGEWKLTQGVLCVRSLKSNGFHSVLPPSPSLSVS